MCYSVTCNDSIYHERIDPENSSANIARMGTSFYKLNFLVLCGMPRSPE
jgi:hypothetical protein